MSVKNDINKINENRIKKKIVILDSNKENKVKTSKKIIILTKDREIWKAMNVSCLYDEIFDKYECSNLGRIRNRERNIIHKLTTRKSGYLSCSLIADSGKRMSLLVHEIIASTFLSNTKKENHDKVLHSNKDILDNRITNLVWISGKDHLGVRHMILDYKEEVWIDANIACISSETLSKYEISSEGRMRNKINMKILNSKPKKNDGYMYAKLTCDSGLKKNFRIHIIIACSFLRSYRTDENKYVDHADRNRSNNKVSNLSWVSGKQNASNRKRRIIKLPKNTNNESIEDELWQPIKNYEKYEISNMGRIKLKNGRIIYGYIHDAYRKVSLCKKGVPKQYRIHRLVAEAFLKRPAEIEDDNLVVDHISGNKLDNRAINLEFVTTAENVNRGCGKRLVLLDNNGEMIKEFNTAQQANLCYGFATGAVARVCRSKTYYRKQYYFRYEEDVEKAKKLIKKNDRTEYLEFLNINK